MNELSVVGSGLDYGIQELSIEDIEMVGGGWRRAVVTLFPIGAEIARDVYNNWDSITTSIERNIEKAWTYHHFHGYWQHGW